MKIIEKIIVDKYLLEYIEVLIVLVMRRGFFYVCKFGIVLFFVNYVFLNRELKFGLG